MSDVIEGSEYDAKSIRVLKAFEGIRSRPAMYVGNTSRTGIQVLVTELLDNCAQQAMAQRCSKISVRIESDGTVVVEDDGPGISTQVQPGSQESQLELLLTQMFSCSCKQDPTFLRVRGGLHGVGLVAVNSLCELFRVETTWNGRRYDIEFQRGVRTQELRDLGPTERRGVLVAMRPDSSIFKDIAVERLSIEQRLREIACLVPGLSVDLVDHRTLSLKRCGAVDLLEHHAGDAVEKQLCIGFSEEIPFKMDGVSTRMNVDVAFRLEESEPFVRAYCNTFWCPYGDWLRRGFCRSLLNLCGTMKEEFDRLDVAPQFDDLVESIAAIISVRLPSPEFQGNRRNRLADHELTNVFKECCASQLKKLYAMRPDDFRAIAAQIAKVALREGHTKAEIKRREQRVNELLSQFTQSELDEISGD